MAAGLSETLWSMTDLAEMVDAAAPKPGPRGPYKKAGRNFKLRHYLIRKSGHRFSDKIMLHQ